MAADYRLVDVCDAEGRIVESGWLSRAEPVHRQLRPDLDVDYVGKLTRIFRDGGRMTLAVQGDVVIGLAVWRSFEDTANGIKFYVDDLVTDETRRSGGAGHALIEALGYKARALGATRIDLDSGVQRFRAHAFYFREGFFILSHNFKKQLV
ncbi:MAG: GNAT family N-acetyltransferase [Candidatus Dactylopiibacterium carminicum]|uniref:N-acetyltransferase n=1 Tax=Candidatus Dactylopiibacterium carminicum TaxID=857335 RepID=A0A272ESM6_9RHOO|nr:GNAT family N-acetyltransferase [Candidatus Dactylopiibacterium carminicum]KAF7599061.1 N-acetyltransferase [Candidatus Dactylopiibacterium carminicum]PAS93088.1 MAG: GNAT family N-acetyltransferase [Candidatus Dactylopiibacterium carminicum]PAS96653.1 MAG: GNAT family N-acetyltransferase [Candidatus Dactylopiibacterium carminicum]PAS99074.1 MAG: GNAT family N-acetyltransferase [Candidatus Dactylopiibacterium carminicum]